MRRRANVGAVTTAGLLAAALVAGCGADERDFAEQAQRFIVFDGDLADRLGVTFTKAECETPASTAPGSRFACSADTDGRRWWFTVTIGDGGTYVVAVDGSTPTDTTTLATP